MYADMGKKKCGIVIAKVAFVQNTLLLLVVKKKLSMVFIKFYLVRALLKYLSFLNSLPVPPKK